MSKSNQFLVASTILILVTFSCSETKKLQKSHLSAYERETLQDSIYPLTMPFNRWVMPAGDLVQFGDQNQENHALDCSLSPDGKWVAVEGRYSVVIMSPETKKIVYRLPLRNYPQIRGTMSTFSGITWHKNGNDYDLYWSVSNSSGLSFVVQALWDNKKLEITKTFKLEAEKPSKTALPNEVLVIDEQEKTMLYVVLNGNDKLVKINTETGDIIWSVQTGVAPYGLAHANSKLYVTNWAGAVPEQNDVNVAGTPWGKAKVDARTGATREGTVSVFNPENGSRLKDITVGLHPNDIISNPDGKYIYVANANSDNISVIDSQTDEVVETISVRLGEKENPYFGDSPNGLGITSDGKTLFVANGMDNAVAVVSAGDYKSASLEERKSSVEGFIPTSAYPGAVCVYKDSLLFVPNIEAEGARLANPADSDGAKSYNSHNMLASVSVIPIPEKTKLADYTETVKSTNQFFRIALAGKLPRENVEPVPIPVRIGEPSVFKHVVYIIKENRTYDQILGDMTEGNGDTSLCIFGRKITPNTHKICKDFLLMDNFYVSGKCSAEGHQWTDMAIVTDYIEKNMRAWFRSYPHVQEDALVYAPTGFIWDNAIKHGKSVRIYGEACAPEFDESVSRESIYNGFLKGEKFEFKNTTTIEPVSKILSQEYPCYGSAKIPDVLRADAFIKEMRRYENMEGDQWPELIIIALPNDHTSGTRPGVPTPRSMVADNDLALGQIIEAISKSRFWKSTAIFATEDDSQAGWDHVSAYRTVGLVASPYSKLNKTVRTNYNQVSMVRTIEQILGLPPMNVMDATASPMFDCFTNRINETPYNSVPNEIPLDEMNPELSQQKGMALHYAKKSLEPQFDKIDQGDDALFNRIIWFAMKGKESYPTKFSGKEEEDEEDEED
jgi:YVTN family beta-propeller protein